MYNCNFCDYNTDNKDIFSDHKTSKTHLHNIINININIYHKTKKDISILKQKLLEQENICLDKNSNKTQNRIINIESITCIVKDSKDIPPLDELIKFILNDIDTNIIRHEKNINNILFHHKNKILHQLIGDHVVRNFENNTLYKQLFYKSVISKEDGNNKKIWTICKNGYKICKILSNNAIKEIISLLKTTIKNEKKYNKLKYSVIMRNILDTIDIKNLKNDTYKHIALHFNINIK